MKKPIVVYAPLPAQLIQALQTRFDVQDFAGRRGLLRDPEFRSALARAQGAIGAGLRVDAAFLDASPALRAISAVSVGVDQYDVAALTARRILLCNTPDVLTESVADLVIALMLATARRVVELDRLVRAGGWRASVDEAQFGRDVHGRTLGIIGMGRIGSAVARRAALGFGMRVLYQSRSAKAEAERDFGALRFSMDELLARSDFVCVLAPLNADTENLVGKRELALMRRDAFLINVARGKVVDEVALIAALREGRIAGAGLDVFVREPLPADSPLLSMENVVALPHIGSATTRTRLAMAELAVDNLVRALSGDTPRAMVNPEIWPLID